ADGLGIPAWEQPPSAVQPSKARRLHFRSMAPGVLAGAHRGRAGTPVATSLLIRSVRDAPKASTCSRLSAQLPVYSHNMRAILAGGGTGGHVIPALAISHELQKQYESEVLFIGTARGIENRLVPAAGFPLRLIEVGALKNVTLTKRVKTIFDLPRSVWESRRILSEFRPDVVIGVGGYAS